MSRLKKGNHRNCFFADIVVLNYLNIVNSVVIAEERSDKGKLALGKTHTKGLPLEGKVSTQLTNEVSYTRNGHLITASRSFPSRGSRSSEYTEKAVKISQADFLTALF